jgi:hypothetical protein
MTDAELAKFLGFENEPKRDALIAALPPEKRAVFDRMAEVEIEADLWLNGLGPKPTGVLIDTVRSTRRRRAWK